MASRRRGIGIFIVVAVLVGGLVGAYFIVDSILRGVAETAARQQISSNLPEGVSGDVDVSIGGFSVIGQYLAGSFERVELTAPELSANGVTARVHVVATGVPTNTAKAIGDVEGTIETGPESINALLAAQGVPDSAEVTFGDGQVTYSGEIDVFGIAVGYLATATPTAAGDSVVFMPVAAEVTTGLGSLDVSGVLERILAENPPTLCVAQYLPEGVEVTGLDVTPERMRVTLQSDSLMLDKSSLATFGTCG